MRQSTTSPYYNRWTEIAAVDFDAARAAVAARDFARLADIAESNCLAMHAVMLSARPSLLYWTGATVDCIACVSTLRAAGEPVFFTIDAGPQVKAVCEPDAADACARGARASTRRQGRRRRRPRRSRASDRSVVTILASAPGKLVVSGEYAVLVGAPALVLAVDRRITCTLREVARLHERRPTVGISTATVTRRTPVTPSRRCWQTRRCHAAIPRTCASTCCGSCGPPASRSTYCLARLSIDIDSRAGYDAGNKLGLGTSAAVCATLTGALLERCGSALDVFPLALAAHRAAQGGRGSGVDVAAACHGGLIRYETTAPAPRIARLQFPAGVAFAAIWTGASADTRSHIADFETWRAGSIPSVLAQLIGAAARGRRLAAGRARRSCDNCVPTRSPCKRSMRRPGSESTAPRIER